MANKKSLKFVKQFVGIFFIIILILLLSSFGGVFSAKGVLGKALSPFISFSEGVSLKIRGFSDSIKELGDLQKENKELEDKVKELTQEISRLKEIQIENESLKKQLSFVNSVGYKTVAARVVVNNPSNFIKIMTINKGIKEGIKKDMAVTSDGFLIGRVYEVDNYMSKILLLTDSNFEVSGLIQKSRALGLVRGQIGSGLAMDTIPKDQEVSVDDTVITGNLENDIPEGLLIGKIVEIDIEVNGLFKKASIVPFVDLTKVKDVVVITGLK